MTTFSEEADEFYKGSIAERLDLMKKDLAILVGRFNESEDHDLASGAQTTLVKLDDFEREVVSRGLHEWPWKE